MCFLEYHYIQVYFIKEIAPIPFFPKVLFDFPEHQTRFVATLKSINLLDMRCKYYISFSVQKGFFDNDCSVPNQRLFTSVGKEPALPAFFRTTIICCLNNDNEIETYFQNTRSNFLAKRYLPKWKC